MQSAFDIAVIGSGFAGSLMAMVARKLGRSVVILEKGRHPRFAIGESSTPLANLILEDLSERFDLRNVRPLAKWGTWQAAHPQIACGLKRGFTFFHHAFGHPFTDDDSRRNQLLVAASPHDRIADTHWYRADFDSFLAAEAQKHGAVYLDEVELWGVEVAQKRPVIQGRHRGQPLEVHANFIIDASGPRGFLQRALDLPEVPLTHLPPTQALYSHFTGVKRWDEAVGVQPSGCSEHTLERELQPYPVDDAAVHHVFDGGWIWVLRFNNSVTSAGVAATMKLARELRLAEGEAAWERLLEKLPSVKEQFADAKTALRFVHSKQLSFLSGEVAGPNWALLPSAAGFIDPLLSTGFPLALLGIERLAKILETRWDRPGFAEDLFNYSMQTTVELSATERLIAALYATMDDFEVFSALSLLYFAAASFTESARRLGKPELTGNTFLLGEHSLFGPRFRYCVHLASQRPSGARRDHLLQQIHQAIEPVNVAGLGRADRRNWYAARADDLRSAAAKLESTSAEIEAMLHRCGFASQAPIPAQHS